MSTPHDMVDFAWGEFAAGIHRFRLKVGGDPALDVARTMAAVEASGVGDTVIGEVSGGWCRQDAILAARALEPLGRVLLEQPWASLEECLAVRRLTTLRLVLDEVINDFGDFAPTVSLRAMDHINLKIGRVGTYSGQAQPRRGSRAQDPASHRGQVGRWRPHGGRESAGGGSRGRPCSGSHT